MAHYAIIDAETNIVLSVITGVDENVTQVDTDGSVVGGSTEAWEAFYAAQPQHAGCIVRRTSFNGNIRNQYAGPGCLWDESRNVFINPQPFPSWVFDEGLCDWVAPVPYPKDLNSEPRLYWDEPSLSWVE